MLGNRETTSKEIKISSFCRTIFDFLDKINRITDIKALHTHDMPEFVQQP
jgi:hypothetical protein